MSGNVSQNESVQGFDLGMKTPNLSVCQNLPGKALEGLFQLPFQSLECGGELKINA